MNRLYYFFLLFITCASAAQQQFPVPKNIAHAYEKGSRSIDGKPGKKYWQNTADYMIHVSFFPDTRVVTGKVMIDYSNNSPDTLQQLWFKLYPNLYKKGSPRESSIDAADLTDGVSIDSFWINKQPVTISKLRINGTNMTVTDQMVLPAQHVQCTLVYHYLLNRKSHIRTGEIEPNAAFIAYFFPRIAVYDDIDGWNKYPYIGSQEFYNDFCNFDVSVTVPKNFIVWATGTLLNGNEVLNTVYNNKIHSAEQNDSVVSIIDTADLKSGAITAEHAFNSWHFTAMNVTDFVFAVSDHYIWKSSSIVVDQNTRRRTRVDAVFNPAHKDYFDVINHARETVKAMSYTFPAWPYPYPHETVFDGLDQMEYPMMVNDNPLPEKADEIELTDHEIFHTMFPFYMGTNETKYGWMDEGWATIGEWIISPIIDSSIVDEYGVNPYEINAGNELDVPITTLTTLESGTSLFLNSYPKPAFGYLFVRDMLGDSLFTKALHYYITQWQGKHPMPYDFFNCINAGSGKNLNWFWKRWFFDSGYPDLAIGMVKKKNDGYSIEIVEKGTKPVPVDLKIIYENNTIEKIHRSISVWEKSDILNLNISTDKKIKEMILGSTYVPDSFKSDNSYKIKQ